MAVARLSVFAVATAMAVAFAPDAATQGVASNGGQLRVFTTRSIATVLAKIGADFEPRTGRKLSITTDVAIRMVRRINEGEPFNLLVAAPAQIGELIRAGNILTTEGVALAGPLPSEIQSYITFTGGISANSKSIAATKELMEVLKSPTAIGVMRSQGMEPGK